MLELVGDRDDLFLDELADGLDDRFLGVGQLHDFTWLPFLLEVLERLLSLMPAARPRSANWSAILRDASSIISLPNITAPRSSHLGGVLVRIEQSLGLVVLVLRSE